MQFLFRPAFELDAVAPDLRTEAVDPAARSRAGCATERWASLFGAPRSRTADFEDWHESAARLFAAIDTGLPVHVLDRETAKAVRRFNTTRDPDPAAPTLFIGTHLRHDPFTRIRADGRSAWNMVWPVAGASTAANRYAGNPGFHAHAGRAVRTATFAPDSPEDGPDLRQAMMELARRGITRQRVKIVAEAKYAEPVPIELPPDPTPKQADDALFEALEYAVIHLEGRPQAFLLQEDVEMRDEYRIVVIDGKPVAGAGCIEHLSPPFHDPIDGAFDPQVEETRRSRRVRRDEILVDVYVDRASLIAADMAKADPQCRHMTIDLAHDGQGRIMMIEANPLDNYGIYAMDMRPVINAMVTLARQPARESETVAAAATETARIGTTATRRSLGAAR